MFRSLGLIRLPHIFWSLLSVLLLYRLGRKLFNTPIGVLAAFLMALILAHIHPARDAHFYSLGTLLLVVANVSMFYSAIRKPTPLRWLLDGAVMTELDTPSDAQLNEQAGKPLKQLFKDAGCGVGYGLTNRRFNRYMTEQP